MNHSFQSFYPHGMQSTGFATTRNIADPHLEHHIAHLRGDIDAALNGYHRLSGNFEDAQRAYLRLTADFEAVQRTNQALTTDVEAIHRVNQDLSAHVATVHRANQDLSADVEAAQAANQHLSADVHYLANRVQHLEAHLARTNGAPDIGSAPIENTQAIDRLVVIDPALIHNAPMAPMRIFHDDDDLHHTSGFHTPYPPVHSPEPTYPDHEDLLPQTDEQIQRQQLLHQQLQMQFEQEQDEELTDAEMPEQSELAASEAAQQEEQEEVKPVQRDSDSEAESVEVPAGRTLSSYDLRMSLRRQYNTAGGPFADDELPPRSTMAPVRTRLYTKEDYDPMWLSTAQNSDAEVLT